MRHSRDTGGYLGPKAAPASLLCGARSALGPLALFWLLSSESQAVTRTGSTTVSATVTADASITVSSPTNLTQGVGAFALYTGSTTVTFSIRTTKVGGSGSITLLAAEFAPAGGPLVSNGDLTYTCSGSPTVGSPCVGTITASTGSATSVVGSIGADAKADGTGVTVNWTLANSPLFSTGTYTSTVTFTLSSN
jgi:hypothetical protein